MTNPDPTPLHIRGVGDQTPVEPENPQSDMIDSTSRSSKIRSKIGSGIVLLVEVNRAASLPSSSSMNVGERRYEGDKVCRSALDQLGLFSTSQFGMFLEFLVLSESNEDRCDLF
ncbi:50S ribosomal protein L33 [Striga asiatica]|uniref:50S ribosomal protein L33 n=1 Tax=Striga asiatica TaxID=4170 RepID=A0A5A7PZW8_STRAF|nr:50S ribosomal protein L33 [Striga asiatica]